MQLVEKQIIQSNNPHDPEIESLYLFAKSLYNYTDCYMIGNILNLPVQIAKKSLLLYIHRSKFWVASNSYMERKSKYQFINNSLRKLSLPKCNHHQKNKYLSLSIYPDYAEIQMTIKNIMGTFVIRDNILYRHHGKLVMADKYNQHKFVFFCLEWVVKLWSYKAKLSEMKTLFDDFFTNIIFSCYQHPNRVSRYDESYPFQFTFSLQKISTDLYKIGNNSLIHADINDSLNISRELVPIAFS
ncbi:hypothetical protein WJM97_16085 [Okeanomitos corallinicola TIOX110]|uniref:Uncharacterized protein n=1 Tax=Okeanomitos corallinicola TIOX110 TaxID=3133117 RepID=A0ABZ2UPK5_9CYAN